MKAGILGCFIAFASASTAAEMPIVLRDNDTVTSPEAWTDAAPKISAALECRNVLEPTDAGLRALLPKNETGQWELVPPNGFKVFGFVVQGIAIYVDPQGEMGASYTAVVAAPMNIVEKAPALSSEKGAIGSLMVEAGERSSLTAITCTVEGTGNGF